MTCSASRSEALPWRAVSTMVTTLPTGSPASSRGQAEYSAVKKLPSLRHSTSFDSRTARPVRRVASSGQADCGKGEPSGWLWWISSCMFRPSTSSAA